MNHSRTKWSISLLAAVLLLSVAGVVNAQSNITAALSVDRKDISVGDVIPLTLRVTHPAGWRVIMPALDKQWGEFELRSQSAPSIVSNGDGTEITSQTIEVARMRPGTVQTPALTLAVADDQGHLQNVEVASVSLTVESVLVAGDTTLRDIKPQADLITSQRTLAPIIGLMVLCLTMLAVYGVKRWRNRPVADRRTPRERALDTFKALAAQNPQTPADLKAACVAIAGCFREYLASTTMLPARDLTTAELARHLKMNDFPAEWSTRVIEVLRVCDSVKFARDVLELTTIHGLIDTTKLLVEQYPPALVQPASRRTKRTHLKRVTA